MMRGNVKALVEQYADGIVKEMLAERMIGIKDFRTSFQPRMVKARTAVIKRLYAEGFSTYAIANILKMNRRTVEGRFNPRVQERIKIGGKRRYEANRAAQMEAQA